MVQNHADFLLFTSAKALANDLATRIRDVLAEAIQKRNQGCLIVSGGTTPIELFKALSHTDLEWHQIMVGLVDERWINVIDVDSNEYLVRSFLLKDMAARARFIGMKTEAGTAVAAEKPCAIRYRKIPKPFDIVILGMGTDGHTASWFPDADRLATAVDPCTGKICVGLRPAGDAYDRMTLALPMILNTRRIIIHIEGEDKRQTYEKAAAGGSCPVMPIRYILGQKEVPVTVFWAP